MAKQCLDCAVELRSEVMDRPEFSKAPATEAAYAVDSGDPLVLHRLRLEHGVAAAVALEFDDQSCRLRGVEPDQPGGG